LLLVGLVLRGFGLLEGSGQRGDCVVVRATLRNEKETNETQS
jgi:hypothetical protein